MTIAYAKSIAAIVAFILALLASLVLANYLGATMSYPYNSERNDINRAVRHQAFALATSCVSVIPIRPIPTDPTDDEMGGKKPSVPWTPFQTSVATPRQIGAWFDGLEPRGLAIVCGAVSGNLEVLDFDAPYAFDEFAQYCADHGFGEAQLPCPLGETPSGGRHLYYRCQEPVGPRILLARRLNIDDKLEIVVEARGEGNYAVIPPSPGDVHPDGFPYRLIRGDLCDLPMLAAEERYALHAMARLLNTYVAPAAIEARLGTATTSTGARPGDDFNERGDIEPTLIKHGWRCVGRRGDVSEWCRPGKNGGISATLGFGHRGLFYPWSTNAAPFEPERAYTPFSTYTLLEHNGDYSAAASALAALGYGSREGDLGHG